MGSKKGVLSVATGGKGKDRFSHSGKKERTWIRTAEGLPCLAPGRREEEVYVLFGKTSRREPLSRLDRNGYITFSEWKKGGREEKKERGGFLLCGFAGGEGKVQRKKRGCKWVWGGKKMLEGGKKESSPFVG